MRASELFNLPNYKIEEYILSKLDVLKYWNYYNSIEVFQKMFDFTGIAKIRTRTVFPRVEKKIPRVCLFPSEFMIYYKDRSILVCPGDSTEIIIDLEGL